jgi:hypothetical protein
MTQADVAAFGSTPLQPIGVDSYVQFRSRQQKGQQPITSTLPFSVDAHNGYGAYTLCILVMLYVILLCCTYWCHNRILQYAYVISHIACANTSILFLNDVLLCGLHCYCAYLMGATTILLCSCCWYCVLHMYISTVLRRMYHVVCLKDYVKMLDGLLVIKMLRLHLNLLASVIQRYINSIEYHNTISANSSDFMVLYCFTP